MAGFTLGDLFGGINFDEIFGGRGFFNRFFRPRHTGPARGGNIEVVVQIPLERVATGGKENVRLSRSQTCSACHGSGATAGTQPKRCEPCGGTGQHVSSRKEGGATFQQITTCSTCRGKGEIIEQSCAECNGRREVEREETLTVNIPAGAEEGMALRVPSHGLPSRDASGAPGDLVVVVRTAPDAALNAMGPIFGIAKNFRLLTPCLERASIPQR